MDDPVEPQGTVNNIEAEIEAEPEATSEADVPADAQASPGLHVLFVAWGFPPYQGPGVERSLATVAELARLGHRVTVLTADLATFDVVTGGDRSLLEQIPETVRVVRVAMAPRALDPLVNRWPATRIADPKAWADTDHKQEIRAFPEPVHGPWQPRAEAVAARIHELDPVDLVIATGGPYVDFTVALRLHVDHGVPFVLDDRDSWLLDSVTGDPRALGDRIMPWLEFALANTAGMWFASPPMAEWHVTNFPQYADRIRLVDSGPERPDAPVVAADDGDSAADPDVVRDVVRDADSAAERPVTAEGSARSTLGSALSDVVTALAS